MAHGTGAEQGPPHHHRVMCDDNDNGPPLPAREGRGDWEGVCEREKVV